MDPALIGTLKDLLIPISGSVTLLSVAISSWLALRQYRLKLKSEKVENDIKLVRAFSDLVNLAHARSHTAYSDRFLDALFEKGVITSSDFEGLTLAEKLGHTALIVPVGAASQDAAITAVATLGLRHDVLADASIQALESLAQIKEKEAVVSPHLRMARAGVLKYRLRNAKRWFFGQ